MSKKLPGLKRRAPDAPGEVSPEPGDKADVSSNVSARPTSGKSKTETKPRRAKRPKVEPIREVSAERDGQTLEAEILPKHSSAGTSILLENAMRVVDKRAKWAAVSGVIPIPVVDFAAIAGVQLVMLKELSDVYGVPFSKNRARAIISALAGSLLPYAAGVGLAGLVVKATPVLGWGIGLATISVLAGAATRAIGLVFIQHFETGGTFFDFDPDAMRSHFHQEYERARKSA